MSVGRGLVRNSFLVFATNLATRVSSALLFLVVARLRQPEVAGIFTLAIGYTLLLEAMSQLGLDQLLIRDVARDRSRTELVFRSLLTVRLSLLAAAIGAFALALSIGRFYTTDTRLVLVFMALVTLPDVTVDMCQALFVATDRLMWPSIVSIVTGFVRVGLGLVVLMTNGTLFHLAIAMLLASFTQMILNVYLVTRQGVRVRLSFAGLHWRSTLAQALPFGVVQLLVAIEAYIGIILLAGAVPDAVLGYYGVANSLLAALLLLPNAIQVAIFPRMTEAYASSRQSFVIFYTRIYRYLAVLGGAVVIGVFVMAEWLTVLLYQIAFGPAAILLQILSGVLFISFLNIPNVRTMIIVEQQKRMAEMLMVSVTFNVILTIVLIPSVGVLAVPIARVASMLCFFAMNQLYVGRRIIKVSLRQILWRPLLGMGVSLGLIIAMGEMSIWLQLTAGLVVYFGTIVALGGLPRDERQYLLSVLLNRSTAQKAHSN